MENNENPSISGLRPLTYSMLINRDKKNKSTVLNLERLVLGFKLDIKPKNGGYELDKVPAFISKSYYEIQNLDKPDKQGFSYNFPPKGPIPIDFICLYCKNKGPDYHKETCKRPFNSSLILENTSSRFPGAEEGTQYSLIVKKSGQKKVVSKRPRSETFTDNVEIIYENELGQQTTIRISRNGTINIISAQIGDDDLPDLLKLRINSTNAVVSAPYVLNSKYIYLLAAQFNINIDQDSMIDLYTLHSTLWTLPVFKKIVDSKTVFMVGDTENYYFVEKYNYNSGEQYSKNLKMTNPYIQFNLSSQQGVKIHVMIYKRGAVQLRASHTNEESNLKIDLKYEILEQVYKFLTQLFTELIKYSHNSNYDIIISETKTAKKSKIPNMVGSQPEKCHNRKSTVAGGGDYRPVPYSFYGTCPMKGYQVRAVKRSDGKYEPCCRKLTDDSKSDQSKERFRKMILYGYPDSDYLKFDENVSINDSAVYVPGTKIVEPRVFPGLKNMQKNDLMSCVEESGYFITNPTIFEKERIKSIYKIFKETVSKSLPKITFKRFKPLITLNPFTKENFMVTPIYYETIRVKLYFNEAGMSYFINEFGDISESGISQIAELNRTEIEGFLFPFQEHIFYPFDINLYNGKELSTLNYYSGTQKRWDYLKSVLILIDSKPGSLTIKNNFDLNIVQGSQYYLENPEIIGLLFISLNGNDKLVWTDTVHGDTTISINVEKLLKNRWKISISGKSFPEDLLPQGSNNDIELPVTFTKAKSDSMIVLCKINLKQTSFTIENRKPLIPLEQLENHINTYDEVINILESIKQPIDRNVFTDLNQNPLGISFNGKVYSFNAINEPLRLTS